MNTNVMESNFAGASSHMGRRRRKRGEESAFSSKKLLPLPIVYLLSSRLDDDGKANIIPTL